MSNFLAIYRVQITRRGVDSPSFINGQKLVGHLHTKEDNLIAFYVLNYRRGKCNDRSKFKGVSDWTISSDCWSTSVSRILQPPYDVTFHALSADRIQNVTSLERWLKHDMSTLEVFAHLQLKPMRASAYRRLWVSGANFLIWVDARGQLHNWWPHPIIIFQL